MPENHFEIDRSTHIRTSVINKEFYNLIVDEKKIFAAKHQLYTFAIMVAVFYEAEPDRVMSRVMRKKVCRFWPE